MTNFAQANADAHYGPNPTPGGVVTMDWERSRWLIARDQPFRGRRIAQATAEGFLRYPERYIGSGSTLVVEATHLAPRTTSKAQVYPAPLLRELQNRLDALRCDVRLFPHRKTTRYEGHASSTERTSGRRDKTYDYLYLMRLVQAVGLPSRRWHAPTEDDLAEHAWLKQQRVDIKEMLNLARVSDYKLGDHFTADPRIDDALEAVQVTLIESWPKLSDELREFYKIRPRNKGWGVTIGRWAPVFTAYACVYDLDRRRRFAGRFSAKYVASKMVGLHEHGYVFQGRATLTYHKGAGSLRDERRHFTTLLRLFNAPTGQD